MVKRRQVAAIFTLLMMVVGGFANLSQGRSKRTTAQSTVISTKASSGSEQTSNRTDPRLRRIGFRSPAKLHQHFEKHGQEFGDVTEAEYLSMAQDLRDAPLSKRILEAEQVGGTVSRFDRSTGAFMAFDRDLTIRTFFRPNDGEHYFRRAAQRSH
jgi:pyocin large subunit-like protein